MTGQVGPEQQAGSAQVDRARQVGPALVESAEVRALSASVGSARVGPEQRAEPARVDPARQAGLAQVELAQVGSAYARALSAQSVGSARVVTGHVVSAVWKAAPV